MNIVHNKYHGTAGPGAIYIGRGSKYGNPFSIGEHGDRDDVCDRFEREILPTMDLSGLIGRDLVCFCKPKRCHGDSILTAIKNMVPGSQGNVNMNDLDSVARHLIYVRRRAHQEAFLDICKRRCPFGRDRILQRVKELRESDKLEELS